MKDCMTCRWTSCRNYGKSIAPCKKYIMSLEEEKKQYIEKMVEKDHITFDNEYNVGLRAIREYGYWAVCTRPEVKYYCMCNGIY